VRKPRRAVVVASVRDDVGFGRGSGGAVVAVMQAGHQRDRDETVAAMLRDLEAIAGVGVDHVTHYELNVGGPTDFARNRSHELPPVDETLEMYRVARDFLAGRG